MTSKAAMTVSRRPRSPRAPEGAGQPTACRGEPAHPDAFPATAKPDSAGIVQPVTGDDPKTMYLREEPGRNRRQILARELMDGDSLNGITTVNFSNTGFGNELGITESIAALRSNIKRVQDGDLSQVEAILYGQATALAAIFHECARRSALNMGQHPEAMERYMRLALKAQSQCRTTLETLVETKHPKSVAFVRQANIAGGHQQINNGEAPPGRAEVFQSEPNELQAGSLASGAPAEGLRANTRPPAMVEVDGAKDRRGEG